MQTAQNSLQSIKETTNVEYVNQGGTDGEETAISGYNQLMKNCDGIGYLTRDLVIPLLGVEESHKNIF